jgi:catechol 2,3-dioxygenase-like lactoylglutathione lyase family enzyme
MPAPSQISTAIDGRILQPPTPARTTFRPLLGDRAGGFAAATSIPVGSSPHGIRHVAFAVEDIDAVVAACEPAALNSSASWGATRTAPRLCYVRGPEGIIIELAEQIG